MNRFVLVPFFFLVGATSAFACSSSDSPAGGGDAGADAAGDGGAVCAPGQSIACVGAGGCAGGQACNTAGTGYGSCVCGAGDGGVGDGGGNDSGGNDSGGDGGGGVTCLSTANALCDQLNMCNPLALQLAYGDVATCKSIGAQACAAPAIPSTNGINDPAACLMARTASCDAFFESSRHPPTACLAKPGGVADQGACGYDSQCSAGDNCDLSAATSMNPACMKGVCSAAKAAGVACDPNTPPLCNSTKAGILCASTFVAGMPPTSDGVTICEAVTYGAAGADCVPGTNKECQAAFYCASTNKCTAKLSAGTSCVAGAGSCDDRVLLSCVAGTCTAPTVVGSGAQCGLVAGVVQTCQGNLYCDSSASTPTCKPKVAAGQGCVGTLAGQCAYGLVCTASTCQAPPPPTCP